MTIVQRPKWSFPLSSIGLLTFSTINHRAVFPLVWASANRLDLVRLGHGSDDARLPARRRSVGQATPMRTHTSSDIEGSVMVCWHWIAMTQNGFEPGNLSGSGWHEPCKLADAQVPFGYKLPAQVYLCDLK